MHAYFCNKRLRAGVSSATVMSSRGLQKATMEAVGFSLI